MTNDYTDLSNVQLHFVDNVEKAQEFLSWLGQRRPLDAVAVDIETGEFPGNDRKDALSPWRGRIRLAQVGDSVQSWAIPWDSWKGVFYQGMKNYHGPIICHNIAFEAKWFALQSEWDIPWGQAHDTLLMAKIIDPVSPAGLKPLSERLIDPNAARLQGELDHGMAKNGWSWGSVPLDYEPYWCVPLTTEILTRSGWKKYNELMPEDETLGYDATTGANRWTKITNVQTFKNAPLVSVGGSHWNTVCTPDHRWLYQMPKSKNGKFDGYGDVRIDPLVDIQSKRNAKLLLSAKAEGGQGSLTPGEAAILAWILSDGSVYWQKEQSSPITSITQHLSKFVDEIRDLLTREGAYVSERVREDSGCVSFYVQSGYVTRLWNKADLWKKTYSDLVLSLSREARLAWWNAWLMAEGTQKKGGGYSYITQNYGPKMDAIVLTAYLEGHHITVRNKDKLGKAGAIALGNRGVTFQKNKPVDAGVGDVWCPTTDLGSWTARDVSGRVFVTGNCYGALDPILTTRLWLMFNKFCGEGAPYHQAYELEMAARKIATRMEINGARVDLEYSQKKYDELIAFTEDAKIWAYKKYNTSITSNIQLVKTFEELGAVIEELTPSGKKSASKDQIKKLSIEGNDSVRELAEMVLKQRKADKLASTYFLNFLEKNADGFLHPSINTVAARTSRMSITEPALQTLPKGDETVRRAFLPKDDDHVIITSDLDQVEFRMFASLSQDENLIGLFHRADAEGSDPFTEIGRQVYQDPSMQKSDKRRGLIKGVVYGRLYGAGVAKQALTAGVAREQMQAVSDSFDENYPGMARFQRAVADRGSARLREEGQGYINTWTGRRVPCDDERTYSLVNYLIQGGAAEIFKSNLVKLDQADLTDYLIVPVHDEIVLQAPRGDAEEIKQLVKECMTTTEGWAVPLTADADGPLETWGDKY